MERNVTYRSCDPNYSFWGSKWLPIILDLLPIFYASIIHQGLTMWHERLYDLVSAIYEVVVRWKSLLDSCYIQSLRTASCLALKRLWSLATLQVLCTWIRDCLFSHRVQLKFSFFHRWRLALWREYLEQHWVQTLGSHQVDFPPL